MENKLCRAVLMPDNAPKRAGPEHLFIGEVSRPELRPNEVLIQVHAAGVNRPDILQRQGLYPAPADASPILGLEVAGEIKAVGSSVSQTEIGRQVCALTNGGGYAEFCAVPLGQCLPIPEGVSLLEAASLPETYFTVWSNLAIRAGLQAGESLLVHGGSSGIGTTAIQIGKMLGAEVCVTVGSNEKANACVQLGADYAFNYREVDFVEAVRNRKSGEFGRGRGVDVILDMVGGDYMQRNLDLLKEEGRLVSIAFLNGSKAEVDFMKVMLKRLVVTGATLRARSTAFKAEIAHGLEQTVWPQIASGGIRPVIDTVFPFEEVAAAHRLMEGRTHVGKIMLDLTSSAKARVS